MRTWPGLPESDDVLVIEDMRVTDAFDADVMSDWCRRYGDRLKVGLRHVTHKSSFYRRHLAGIDAERIDEHPVN